MRPALTAEVLRSILSYDKDTGDFTWLESRGRGVAGRKAGWLKPCGYIDIWVCGTSYRAHRLAWLYVHGCWPTAVIDHINLVRSDNRLCNLREASRSQNAKNKTPIAKTKMPGAHWHKRDRCWRSEICVDGRKIHLGTFPSEELAHAAYCKAVATHHREFASHSLRSNQ